MAARDHPFSHLPTVNPDFKPLPIPNDLPLVYLPHIEINIDTSVPKAAPSPPSRLITIPPERRDITRFLQQQIEMDYLILIDKIHPNPVPPLYRGNAGGNCAYINGTLQLLGYVP